MNNKELVLLSYKDAYEFLEVSKTTFDKLIKEYKISHHKTSSGRIFEKSVLEEFQKSEKRQKNLKHRLK